jgi:hypothetical protein
MALKNFPKPPKGFLPKSFVTGILTGVIPVLTFEACTTDDGYVLAVAGFDSGADQGFVLAVQGFDSSVDGTLPQSDANADAESGEPTEASPGDSSGSDSSDDGPDEAG